MKYRSLVIAVDGPAGSGKSTTASQAAGNLGYLFLDTGAMYRALGLVMIRSNVSPDDPQSSASHAESVRIDLQPEGEGVRVLLDGEDVSKEIRTSVVSDAASRVAIHPGVREVLVARQQEMGRDGGVVAEGRDTGTVVFPSADLKVFLHASAAKERWRGEADLPLARFDTAVSVSLGGLISVAILLTAAALPLGLARVSGAGDMARALEPLLGGWAGAFFSMGLAVGLQWRLE